LIRTGMPGQIPDHSPVVEPARTSTKMEPGQWLASHHG
jgi:hypothetical protein